MTWAERLIARIKPQANGCWNWTGAVTGNRGRPGYGHVRLPANGPTIHVHRLVYLLAGNTIPPGMVLDHTCRNTVCCNPAHLEPVTNAENVRRGAAVKTTCRHGHPFDAENTRITPQGARRCRACHRQAVARRRAEVNIGTCLIGGAS